MTKTITLVLGVLLIAIGGVWFFQGMGALAGSPMTGVSFWAFAGAAFFIAGVILIVVGLTRRRR